MTEILVPDGRDSKQIPISAEDSKPADGSYTVDASGPLFNGCKVNWQPYTEGYTDEATRYTTAITWYSLYKSWVPGSDWRLSFTCRDTYEYFFHDATDTPEGVYKKDVVSTSSDTHTIDYNSSNPAIVSIDGH